MTALIARCLRGLEWVVAAEVAGRCRGRVTRTRHREVWFEADEPAALDLRTADDVFRMLGAVSGIGRSRDDLGRVAGAAEDLDVPPNPVGFEVVATFVSARNYNRYDVEDTLGEAISARVGGPYFSRRAGQKPPSGLASFRVTIEGDEAAVAVRSGAHPLHRRPYKQGSVVGTLHPPAAAALALLAGLRPGQDLLDPCCGAGTIVIEAGRLELVGVFAGDIDARALTKTAGNASRAAVHLATWRADAARLPLASGSVDRVVSNLPWSKRLSPGGALSHGAGMLWSEVRRVLRPGGRAVVMIGDAGGDHRAAIEGAGLHVAAQFSVHLMGARPTVLVAGLQGATALDDQGFIGPYLATARGTIA